MHDRPGRRDVFAERYELIELVGSGGVAEVWRAVDRRLAREVAVKILSGPAARDPNHRRRIEREAQALARIAHPNVIAVFDYGEDGSSGGDPLPYVVMELATGPDLARHLATTGPLRPDAAVPVLVAILEGVAQAHAIGIVHGDLKPANVFLSSDGPKVGDFGVARILAEETGTTTIAATPAYAAPEVLKGRRPTIASDVYSAACIAFESVTGRPPFTGQTFYEVTQQHLEAPVPSAAELDPTVPPDLDAVIRRGLAKDASERFGSASSFAGALRSVLTPEPGVDLAGGGRWDGREGAPMPDAGLAPPPPARHEPVAPDEASVPPDATSTAYDEHLDGAPAVSDAVAAGDEPPGVADEAGTDVEQDEAKPDDPGSPIAAGWHAGSDQATVPVEPRPTEVLPDERHPRRGAAMLGAVLTTLRRIPLGVALAFAAVLLLMAMKGQATATAEVPELTGMVIDRAEAVAEDSGFTTRVEEVARGGVQGTVVGQRPPSGTLRGRGTEVVLEVTSGTPQARVPAVVGMQLADARGALEAAGLVAGEVLFRLSEEPAGSVLEARPAPGSSVDAGSSVELIVAANPVEERDGRADARTDEGGGGGGGNGDDGKDKEPPGKARGRDRDD